MHQGRAAEITPVDFIEAIPAVDVPIFFLVGAHDYNTPLQLVREYFDAIDAPQMGLVAFERSAHTPFLKEGEAFSRAVVEVKRATSHEH